MPRFLAIVITIGLSALSFAATLASGSEEAFALREWHISDGLPSEEVHRIQLSQDGFLLIAGPDGLMRFDGRHFKTLATKSQLGAKLFGVSALLDTPDHGLLLALRDGGLYKLTPEGLAAAPFAQNIANLTTIALHASPDQSLWIATNDNRLFLLPPDSRSLQEFTPWGGPGLEGKSQFATDSDGTLWATNGDELARFVNGAFHLHPVPLQPKELRIISSKSGPIWLTADQRLQRISPHPDSRSYKLPSLLGAHYIQDSLETPDGAIWLGTRSQGLWRIDSHGPKKIAGLGDDIYRIARDPDGNLWIGSNGYGLYRIRSRSYHLYDRADGLTANYSRTLAQAPDGAVWLANGDGGLVRILDGVLQFSRELPKFADFSPFIVSPRRDGSLWTTTSNRLYQVAPWPAFDLLKRAEDPRLPIFNTALTASNGDLYLAAPLGPLCRFRETDTAFAKISQGLPEASITTISEAPDQTIWIGLENGTVHRLEGERFQPVPLPENLRTGPIQAIAFPPDGSTWIATSLAGVLIKRGPDFQQINSTHGFPSDDITQILFDDYGFAWFASLQGIFKTALGEIESLRAGQTKSLRIARFGKDDGLENLSCIASFQPGSLKAQDGTLWFSTRLGVIAFNPDPAFHSATPPRAFIDSLTINGRLQADFHRPDRPLKLRAGMRRIAFQHTALCLSHPDDLHVETRLDGFDDQWIPRSAENETAYPSLPPGDYTFQLRVSNGYDQDSTQSLAFTVLPLWHQTLAFRILASLALLALTTALVRHWSHRRLQQEFQTLERAHALERERARISQDIHDDLGASLTRISLLSDLAQGPDSPQRASALQRISQSVSELTRSMDQIVWAVNPRFDNLESLAYYLSNFAQKFLSLAQIRCRLDFPETLPDLPLNSQTRHNLFACSKEALNNIVRHSQATEVTLALSLEENALQILIRDNGQGIPLADAPRTDHPHRDASGNGLLNMRKRMAEIHGAVTIRKPRAHNGLTIIFRAPLPK